MKRSTLKCRSIVYKHDPTREELTYAWYLLACYGRDYEMRSKNGIEPVYFGFLQVGWRIDYDEVLA